MKLRFARKRRRFSVILSGRTPKISDTLRFACTPVFCEPDDMTLRFPGIDDLILRPMAELPMPIAIDP
ncbi:hypothetical protein [Paraburkholderia strydomiana]|uniref:hypothetical protein n=1 Tax=Paraburkholderia strydomiana TaxID=1245417 RepID=UPI00285AA52D|nr:hypothetical protein [Paraburkholderia strydomiana]MDR7006200.1 hypothetical protein [Paraburkholderia strydomiana]